MDRQACRLQHHRRRFGRGVAGLYQPLSDVRDPPRRGAAGAAGRTARSGRAARRGSGGGLVAVHVRRQRRCQIGVLRCAGLHCWAADGRGDLGVRPGVGLVPGHPDGELIEEQPCRHRGVGAIPSDGQGTPSGIPGPRGGTIGLTEQSESTTIAIPGVELGSPHRLGQRDPDRTRSQVTGVGDVGNGLSGGDLTSSQSYPAEDERISGREASIGIPAVGLRAGHGRRHRCRSRGSRTRHGDRRANHQHGARSSEPPPLQPHQCNPSNHFP